MLRSLFVFTILCFCLYTGCKKPSKTTVLESAQDFAHGSHPGYFTQWFEEHKNEQGIIPEGLHQAWYAHDLAQLSQAQAENETPVVAVEQLAPTVMQGGRTRAILVDARDSNLMWAGAVSGGLWRSTNGGATWRPINDAASSLSVVSICQNPLKTNEIYYGTGEVRGASQGIGGAGVWKSTDGGLTFDLLPSTAAGTVGTAMRFCNYMAHSQTDDKTLYVGTSSGLYRSSDAGLTWTSVLAGASAGIICFPNGQVLASVQGQGLHRSLNGLTFTPITNASFPSTSVGRVLIDHCKAFPNVVYALFNRSGSGATYTSEANMGVFKSSDFGQTWVKRGDSSSTNGRIGTTYTNYCQMLGVHPRDTNRLVIGALSVKRSMDGGVTYQSVAVGHSDNHTAVHIGSGETYLIGSDGGVHRSTWANTGTTNLNSGYITFQFYAGNYAPTGRLAAGGLQDNGTWRYRGGAANSIFGGDGAYTHISQQDSNLAYCATQNGPVYRTTGFTTGISPSSITPSAAVSEGVDFINQYEINYADGYQLYYRTAKGLWRTKTASVNWARLNRADISGISAVGVEAKCNPSVYIGGNNCFYRFDSAATFDTSRLPTDLRTSVPSAIKNHAWGTISFHPSVSTTLFVGLTTVAANRAWRVRDAHTSNPIWENISGNMPTNLSCYQIQAHPDKPDSVLFAATAFGLYYTTNGGTTWVKETRIPNVPIFEMKLRASDRSLFLFTHGRGIWHIQVKDLRSTTRSREASEKIAVKIYPNPTANWLNVETQHPLSMVQVFDAKGREVFIERQNTQRLNVAHLPNGLYWLRLFDEKGRYATQQFLKTK
jgi:hypothetical protein